ncbi:tRNA synthetases class II-domain-containing protein [Crepidotus variabilis]|uniref:tRNA synthetases class II-domain-containing protein n=1 Tax=Crepidotus variabilis TaxID=179855 RepID=A0A9P6ESV7_9AGAR|nr:tRNA synthetases class II-domain-containing protein [Crepidotus variabilis]
MIIPRSSTLLPVLRNASVALRAYSTPHSAPYPSRTHTCGSLSSSNEGGRVVLAGWILPERKMKTINKSFFHLKDSYGTTQLLVDHLEGDCWGKLSTIPVESTVLVEGRVALRPTNAVKQGNTGTIDVLVEKVTLLNPAHPEMPFLPSNTHNLPNEELRGRFRYLDLRRNTLSDNIKKRSQVAHIVRSVLHEHDFIEVETPVLLRSSPEGAREFLVPARITNSLESNSTTKEPHFYALAQSPQQPKQLLICSGGVDRYFQIAKCFRDEDGRKDRQPEFTQIDLEMAFVSWGDSLSAIQTSTADNPNEFTSQWRIGGSQVRDVIERLVRTIWKTVQGVELPKTFKVMTYDEAMTRFGSDKPDTRFGLEILNLTDLLLPNKPNLSDVILECIVVRKSQDPGFIKASHCCALEGTANSEYECIALSESSRKNWLLKSKFASQVHPDLSPEQQTNVNKLLKLKAGDNVWLAFRRRLPKGGSTALGRVRLQIFDRAQSRGEFEVTKESHFLWITEFPLFTRDDADKEHLAHGRWSSSHHPFTAPMWEDVELLYRGEAEKVRGQHYDLVLNGVEIGGGSVRIHDAAMQDFIFTHILKLSDSEKFPFNQLLHALQCGAPPHGGIALGFDRIMAILCNTQSIRDVIAFPKAASGTDLLFKSPAPVSNHTLQEYGLQTRHSAGQE